MAHNGHSKWSAVAALLLALAVRSAEANAGVCGHMMLDSCCKFVQELQFGEIEVVYVLQVIPCKSFLRDYVTMCVSSLGDFVCLIPR